MEIERRSLRISTAINRRNAESTISSTLTIDSCSDCGFITRNKGTAANIHGNIFSMALASFSDIILDRLCYKKSTDINIGAMLLEHL
jgi:hypothetical protein